MRRLLTLLPLAAILLLAIPPVASADDGDGDGPTATAARACPLSAYRARRLGTTYVRSLRQHGTKCRHARKVVRAFNRCRKNNGGRDGYCNKEISDYDCNENRYLQGVGQFRSKVRCFKGNREISWKYTQNTD